MRYNLASTILEAISFILVCIFIISIVQGATPNGAGVTTLRSETAPNNDTAGSRNSISGNLTEINVNGRSITQSWQGYFGNITGGAIRLANSANAIMYNWTLANSQGEIFASTNQTISWGNIQCFNFTAAGNLSNGAVGETAGATNLRGINVSQLETQYGIAARDFDGVNETFSLSGAGTHDSFSVASQGFSEGECPNTRLYGNTGQGVNNQFEEVLLYEPATSSVIFASLLEQDSAGFDNASHDFEMLVLENGHAGDTSTTPYYFFLELQ